MYGWGRVAEGTVTFLCCCCCGGGGGDEDAAFMRGEEEEDGVATSVFVCDGGGLGRVRV